MDVTHLGGRRTALFSRLLEVREANLRCGTAPSPSTSLTL
jgi:hypothetical protein